VSPAQPRLLQPAIRSSATWLVVIGCIAAVFYPVTGMFVGGKVAFLRRRTGDRQRRYIIIVALVMVVVRTYFFSSSGGGDLPVREAIITGLTTRIC